MASEPTKAAPAEVKPADDAARQGFLCTDEEWEKLVQLRTRVADLGVEGYWGSEQALHRFIVARKLDVDAAEKQYRGAIQWRRDNNIDNVLKWYWEPELVKKFYPSTFHGTDNGGYPLLIEFTGRTDLAHVFAALGEETFLRYVAWYHERQENFMQSCRAADGTARHKMSVIVDLTGLSMRLATSAVYGALQKRVRVEEDNYPEVVRTVSLVNAPTIFTAIWAVVSAFLDDGTRSKIAIFGSKFEKDLQKRGIPTATLPAELGGSFADHGVYLPSGPLPAHFREGYGVEGDTVTLDAGKTLELAVPLGPGESISWDFVVQDGRDIQFSAFAVPAADAGAVGLKDATVTEATGASQTGYAVVRPASCPHDDGSTATVTLGVEPPVSGASELHGAQAIRAKAFKTSASDKWTTVQSAGKVKTASNKYPLEASLPTVRYSCSQAWAPPRIGAYWSPTPPEPHQPAMQVGEAAPAASAAAAAPATTSDPSTTDESAAAAGAGGAEVEDHCKRAAGSAASTIVVLRWSNADSWMKNKVFARRVLVWSAEGAAAAVAAQPAWLAAKADFDARRVSGATAAGAAGAEGGK